MNPVAHIHENTPPFQADPFSPLVLYPQGKTNRCYTVLKILDEGSNGVIWKVRTLSGRIAALKISPPGERYWNASIEEAQRLKRVTSGKAPDIAKYERDFDLAPACHGDRHPNLCIGAQRHAILMEILREDVDALFIWPSTLPEILPQPKRFILYSADTNEPYELIKKRGDGGHAQIWEVLTSKGPAALKIHRAATIALLQQFGENPFLAGSIHEAIILQFIRGARHVIGYKNHFFLKPACYKEKDPNLCIVHEGTDTRRHAILMDLLPCENISTLIDPANLNKISFAQIMDIGRQMLEVLEDFKKKHLIHRDLKPSNVAYNGELYLYDFDSSGKVENVNPNIMYQTRWYRAPELFLSKKYDEGADLWSLGCILFELYTGGALFVTWGNEDNEQKTTDHLYLVMENMGERLSHNFIRSAPNSGYPIFEFYKEKGIFGFKYFQSFEATRELARYHDLAEQYPKVPLWQARIYDAFEKRGANTPHPQPLIDLIAPMLLYENRPEPTVLLKKHFPAEERKTGS